MLTRLSLYFHERAAAAEQSYQPTRATLWGTLADLVDLLR